MWKSLILALALVIPSWGAGCASSWGNGYTYCRAVTINHIHVSSTTQTNFPVLVTGTLTYLKTVGNGGRVQSASGLDITFASDQNGGTVLSFERAVWSATTGTVEFWIKIPSVSASADVTFYMFYGKSGVVVDPADPTNVWDANYVGVWHFGDGTTLDLNDSTSHANTGTNHGATACTGQIRGAACFVQASSQYIDVGNDSSLELTSAITIESWVKYTGSMPLNASTFPVIVNNIDPTNTNGYGLLVHGDNTGAFSDLSYFQTVQSGLIRPLYSLAKVTANTIYAVAGSYDSGAGGNNANEYLNTANRNNAFGASAITADTTHITFSKGNNAGLTQYWQGFLDEIRISNIQRSSDWLTTGYNNTFDPNTFYTIGNETVLGSGGGPRIYVFK